MFSETYLPLVCGVAIFLVIENLTRLRSAFAIFNAVAVTLGVVASICSLNLLPVIGIGILVLLLLYIRWTSQK